MSTDSFTSALERLDPASRALLDLSLRRGMRTEEIADVLGAEPANVEASRDEALRRIAAEVGMDTAGDLDEVRARLAELPVEGWLGQTNGNGAHAAAGKAESGKRKAEEPEAPRRRVVLPLLLGALVIAAVVLALVLGTGGGSSDKASSKSAPSPPPAKPAGGGVALTPVGAVRASGTASVKNGKLNLRITGLPKERYGVWLFNNVIDARSLGYAEGTTIVGKNLELPKNWRGFRYVDISREPNDGNLNHSGLSVMRVPTSRLAGGS
jgi:hypothetical protein